jgi:hypothetical protein
MALGNAFDDRNLPHFTSRKEAGIGKEEPLYVNCFIITFIPPAALQAKSGDLLMAQTKTISGLVFDKEVSKVQQSYRGAKRNFAAGFVDDSTLEFTCSFNLNQNEAKQVYIRDILKRWKRLIYDPTTGRRGLKANYVGSAIIEYFDRAGDIFERFTVHNVFPISAVAGESYDGDYDSTEIRGGIEMTFCADYHTEETA